MYVVLVSAVALTSGSAVVIVSTRCPAKLAAVCVTADAVSWDSSWVVALLSDVTDDVDTLAPARNSKYQWLTANSNGD